ncbi:MAG: hypothetical protein HZB51_23710 [Chloroflexi bacterium]|nr:hypothetical protein [Chloroflexota bacterium]
MTTVRSFLQALWLHRIAVMLAVMLLLIVAMIAATVYTYNLPKFALDHQQTIVLGATQFAPDNPSSLRVVVRDDTTNAPIANANVAVKLAPKGIGFAQTLYSGKTDASGSVPVAFTLPSNVSGDQTLVIETDSGSGRDHIERAIKVVRNYKLLITTDKPLYQPSQVIHLRALALGSLDRLPAKDQPLEFLIEDPKGNKIYRKTIQTSAYGIASVDFTLADTINSGAYKITASMGDTKSEKTVTVKPYVLPKFKLAAETERGYYLPGEKVNGTIHADYFFGKPVAKSDVTIKGIVYDVARAETINITGKTDDQGAYAFSFTLPNYFAASGLNKTTADFGLEVSVTDQANHMEQTSLSLAISKDAITIDAVPESGKLVPGVENIVYVLTSLPDGSPLEADLTIGNVGTTKSGKYGLAQIRLTPQRGNTILNITARDAKGRSATRSITLSSDTTASQVLLRPDQATYQVGNTMHLDVLTGGSIGSVYLDIIKEKQTLSTRTADIVNGRATIDVDVTPDLIGTLQLHAYQVERDSTITRDTRIVVVEQASELNVAIKADRDVYRPGDPSKVTFTVTDSKGKGVQSALGVTGVDEAVFAMAEQDPGFAKLYFLLQQELLEPKYQVKGFSLPEVVAPKPTAIPADVRAAQNQSARAAWANATPIDFVLRANSQPEKIDAANKAQKTGFNNLAAWLGLFMSILPLVLIGLVIASLHARKVLGKSLGAWMAGLLVYCVASPFFVGGIAIIGGLFVQAKFGVILVAIVFLAWLIAFGILVGYAIVKRDRWLQGALLLLAAYFVFLALFAYVAQRATSISDLTAVAVIITWLAGIAAVTLMGMGYFVQKETTPGIASILIVLLFIPATILLALMPSAGPFLRVMGNPGMYIPPAYLTGCAAAPTPFPGQSDSNAFKSLEKTFGGVQQSGLAAAPTAAPMPAALAATPVAGQAQQTGTEAPRLRQYFPETLYFNPQAITNENGTVTLDIPLADSITTWRLAATASSQKGELGTATTGIRVFQDFFVDLDLPVALTQNDEISIPVAVYNYLPQAQKVKLQIDQQSWFTLQDEAEKTLSIASNDIDVVYFRIKATSFGMQKLKVTALGEKMSDAIQREIRVYPDGKSIEASQSNWLKDGAAQTIDIPAPAIPGATRLEVKVYPGVMSQVVDGLDSILRMPFG